MAAAANQPLIVEDLLSLGAEPNATDHQGRSVLHVAATYGLPGVLSVGPVGRSRVFWDGLVIQILVSRTMFRQTLPQLSLFFSQAVFKSGIQVDLEARDFEGKLVMARAGAAGRLAGQGWMLRYKSLTVYVPQALPRSTQPSWPSMLLCSHLVCV